MPEKRILCDTVVLSNFSQGGLWPKFVEWYAGKMCVSIQVYDEICRGLAKHPFLREVAEVIETGGLERMVLSDHEFPQYKRLLQFLGTGEASSIALAHSRRWTMATDDLAARRECEGMGIRLTGTVGILIRACRTRRLKVTEADGALERMIQAGFFSPVLSISGVI